MYSPKIREDLISRLYRLARAGEVPMTQLVNRLLEQGIAELEHEGEKVSEPPQGAYQRRQTRQKEER